MLSGSTNLRIMLDKYTGSLEHILSDHLNHELAEFDSAAVAYSGGLDCSVIAKICSNLKPISLYVVGTSDSQDLKSAKSGAESLDLTLNEIIIDINDVETAIPELVKILKSRNALEISIELSFYFVCKKMKEDVILTGQGADELFGGYSRYLRMDPGEREDVMKFDTAQYLQYNLKQEERIAGAFDKKLITTYMSPLSVDYIESIPMEFKIRKNERKFLLKELGRNLGLPNDIISRPKKAVQYGSGILNLMRSLASAKNLEIHEYVKQI